MLDRGGCFLTLYFGWINTQNTNIIPNMSSLARGRKNIVMEEIEGKFAGYISRQWEYLCRESVSGNLMFGHRWGEAGRWWGTVPGEGKGMFREMEFDVMAESTDGNALLVGECKWTNPEITSDLHRRLLEKANRLPLAKGKEIVSVLFLKNKPKNEPDGVTIVYPQDVIQALYAD